MRNAARRGKKTRFAPLLHRLSQETLRTAFFALRRRRAADAQAGALGANASIAFCRLHSGGARAVGVRRESLLKGLERSDQRLVIRVLVRHIGSDGGLVDRDGGAVGGHGLGEGLKGGDQRLV